MQVAAQDSSIIDESGLLDAPHVNPCSEKETETAPQRLEPGLPSVSTEGPVETPCVHTNGAERREPRAAPRVSIPPLSMNALALSRESESSADPSKFISTSAQDDLPRTLSGQDMDHRSFRLLNIRVDVLQADNTLGLLMNGTCIVGFRTPEAKDVGWCMGDKIVEVNGLHVGTFDDFLYQFREAQAMRGFPVHFGVIRCHDICEAEATAEDTLRNFFSSTDIDHLTGQLRDKWGEPLVERQPHGKHPVDMASTGSLRHAQTNTGNRSNNGRAYPLEHPFVTALKLRRDALVRGNAGWSKFADDDFADASDSVASRLAQRQDGVSTLHISREDNKANHTSTQAHKSCGWTPGWFCSPGSLGHRFEAVDHEIAPTPRIHHYGLEDSRSELDAPWLTSASSSRTVASDCVPPIVATSALAGPPAAEENADAALLVQLLLASGTLNLESDDEEGGESEASKTAPVQQPGCTCNVVQASATATVVTSADVSRESDDLEILLPRRQLPENGAGKGTVHANAQSLPLDRTTV